MMQAASAVLTGAPPSVVVKGDQGTSADASRRSLSRTGVARLLQRTNIWFEPADRSATWVRISSAASPAGEERSNEAAEAGAVPHNSMLTDLSSSQGAKTTVKRPLSALSCGMRRNLLGRPSPEAVGDGRYNRPAARVAHRSPAGSDSRRVLDHVDDNDDEDDDDFPRGGGSDTIRGLRGAITDEARPVRASHASQRPSTFQLQRSFEEHSFIHGADNPAVAIDEVYREALWSAGRPRDAVGFAGSFHETLEALRPLAEMLPSTLMSDLADVVSARARRLHSAAKNQALHDKGRRTAQGNDTNDRSSSAAHQNLLCRAHLVLEDVLLAIAEDKEAHVVERRRTLQAMFDERRRLLAAAQASYEAISNLRRRAARRSPDNSDGAAAANGAPSEERSAVPPLVVDGVTAFCLRMGLLASNPAALSGIATTTAALRESLHRADGHRRVPPPANSPLPNDLSTHIQIGQVRVGDEDHRGDDDGEAMPSPHQENGPAPTAAATNSLDAASSLGSPPSGDEPTTSSPTATADGNRRPPQRSFLDVIAARRRRPKLSNENSKDGSDPASDGSKPRPPIKVAPKALSVVSKVRSYVRGADGAKGGGGAADAEDVTGGSNRLEKLHKYPWLTPLLLRLPPAFAVVSLFPRAVAMLRDIPAMTATAMTVPSGTATRQEGDGAVGVATAMPSDSAVASEINSVLATAQGRINDTHQVTGNPRWPGRQALLGHTGRGPTSLRSNDRRSALVICCSDQFDDRTIPSSPQAEDDALELIWRLHLAGSDVTACMSGDRDILVTKFRAVVVSYLLAAADAAAEQLQTRTLVSSVLATLFGTAAAKGEAARKDGQKQIHRAADEIVSQWAAMGLVRDRPSSTTVRRLCARHLAHAALVAACQVHPAIAAAHGSILQPTALTTHGAEFLQGGNGASNSGQVTLASSSIFFLGSGVVDRYPSWSSDPTPLFVCSDSKMTSLNTMLPVFAFCAATFPYFQTLSLWQKDLMATAPVASPSSTVPYLFGLVAAASASSPPAGAASEADNVLAKRSWVFADLRGVDGATGVGLSRSGADGGDLFVQYPSTSVHSKRNLLGHARWVLISLLNRALRGKALREGRISTNSVHIFCVERLMALKWPCYSTCSNLLHGTDDLCAPSLIAEVKNALKQYRRTKRASQRCVAIQCLVPEQYSRGLNVVASLIATALKKFKGKPLGLDPYQVPAFFPAQDRLFVAFRTKDAYSAGCQGLILHLKHHYTFVPNAAAASPANQPAQYNSATVLRDVQGEAQAWRLRVDVGDPRHYNAVVATVREYMSHASLAAVLHIPCVWCVYANERTLRKLNWCGRLSTVMPDFVQVESTRDDPLQSVRLQAVVLIQRIWRKVTTGRRVKIADMLLQAFVEQGKRVLVDYESSLNELVSGFHERALAAVRLAEDDARGLIVDESVAQYRMQFEGFLERWVCTVLYDGGGYTYEALQPCSGLMLKEINAGNSSGAALLTSSPSSRLDHLFTDLGSALAITEANSAADVASRAGAIEGSVDELAHLLTQLVHQAKFLSQLAAGRGIGGKAGAPKASPSVAIEPPSPAVVTGSPTKRGPAFMSGNLMPRMLPLAGLPYTYRCFTLALATPSSTVELEEVSRIVDNFGLGNGAPFSPPLSGGFRGGMDASSMASIAMLSVSSMSIMGSGATAPAPPLTFSLAFMALAALKEKAPMSVFSINASSSVAWKGGSADPGKIDDEGDETDLFTQDAAALIPMPIAVGSLAVAPPPRPTLVPVPGATTLIRSRPCIAHEEQRARLCILEFARTIGRLDAAFCAEWRWLRSVERLQQQETTFRGRLTTDALLESLQIVSGARVKLVVNQRTTSS